MASFLIPQIFNFIQTQQPKIEAMIVEQMTKVKNSNPNSFKMFVDNWRKLNGAIERTAAAPPPAAGGSDDPSSLDDVSPPDTPELPPKKKGGLKGSKTSRRSGNHKKRTNKVKHRKH